VELTTDHSHTFAYNSVIAFNIFFFSKRTISVRAMEYLTRHPSPI
jgi:hypothetical protein